MRKLLTIILALCITESVKAQWNTSSNNIYNSNIGNVGIGITSPEEKLHVNGLIRIQPASETDNDSPGIVGTSNDDFNYLDLFFNTNGLGFHYIYDPLTNFYGMNTYLSSTGGMDFFVQQQPRLRISSNGNVGIGRSAPVHKLDVNGNVNASGFYVNGQPLILNSQWVTNSSSIYFTSGNVGIGTTTPSDKLTVFENSSSLWAGNYSNTHNSGKGVLIKSGQSTFAGSILQLEDNAGNKRMIVRSDGKVGIGTMNPDYLLTVNGKIKSEELQVVTDVPADYVFESDYNLMPLDEIENFVKIHKHLPGIPSAPEIIKDGWQVGKMSNKLLEKIEELTLHVIQLNKENEDLKQRLEKLERNHAKN